MEEKEIIIKNLKVAYKTFGPLSHEALAGQGSGSLPEEGGKTMLILHGWPSKSERWQKVAEMVAEKGLTIIVPDLPGFGQSQEPLVAWNLDTYVEWVREFTEKIPALQKEFYLAGHSFGGGLASKFTIKYNQRVEKLFLISAACIRQKTTTKKTAKHISKVVKVFSFLPFYELFRKAVYKFILRRSDYAYVSGIMKETYLRVISDDLSQKLGFIKSPTIIIWGDKDTSTPIADAEFMHGKIPGSKLFVIPGADHALQIKVPEVLAQHIIENL